MDTKHRRAARQGHDPAFPRLLGERLCLDFANSVEPRLGPDPPTEYLRGYPDLVRWGRHVGVLSEGQGRGLLADADRHPDAAAAAFARAVALREAIYRLFRAIARGKTPAAADLATLQQEHALALAHARLVAMGDGFDLVWDETAALDRVLGPVARSAVNLVLAGEATRVKECPGPAGGCGWLFYDTSKNASRRWCSMEGCGSQAKMRRYRARRTRA